MKKKAHTGKISLFEEKNVYSLSEYIVLCYFEEREIRSLLDFSSVIMETSL